MATNEDGYRSDDAVLAEFGSRLNALRLMRDMTQAQLAHEAGISKRTLERIEAGKSAQITSYVRVLRTLNLLNRLEDVLPAPQLGPMDLLQHAGKFPQRARGSQNQSEKPWTWGED